MMRIFFKIFQWLVATIGVVFVLMMASPLLPISDAIRVFTVRSGSMEPAILTGSLIFVRPSVSYVNGDIITVQTSDQKTVTHRIVETLTTDVGPAYRTKGDNNEEPDPVETQPGSILGKTILVIPYLGYPVAYAQTRTGFFTLIFIPALLIIASEIVTIAREARRILRERRMSAQSSDGHQSVIAKNIIFSQPMGRAIESPLSTHPTSVATPTRRKIV